jgi:hypothetical protein
VPDSEHAEPTTIGQRALTKSSDQRWFGPGGNVIGAITHTEPFQSYCRAFSTFINEDYARLLKCGLDCRNTGELSSPRMKTDRLFV